MSEHIDDRAVALAALDEGDPEWVTARAHADACPDCARALDEGARIMRSIDDVPAFEPPAPDLLRQISSTIQREMAADARRQSRALAAMFPRVKAWYLSAAVIGQLAVVVHALVMAAIGDRPLAWIGAALAIGAVPTRVLSYYVIHTPRTSRWMFGLLATAVAGVALLVASGSPPKLAVAECLLGVASAAYYVFGYSRFGRQASSQLAVGAQLPHFLLENDRGEPVDVDRYRGAPVVFLFFRGNWCPLCMAQIHEIAAQYRELHELGVKVALVSPQPHHNTAMLSKRYDVAFDFLVDPGTRAARRLGILHEAGVPAGLGLLGYARDTVLPTVVVADREGKILFSDQTDNYRLRPEPSTFLSVLRPARS